MLKNLLKLIFPSICYGCEKLLLENENVVCTTCRHELPLTKNHSFSTNEITNKFYGITELSFGASMLYFTKKGIVQKLIHNLKYKNKQEIGNFLGKWYAEDLKKIQEKEKFDLIIPVPLHPKKRKQRGYNQIDTFCIEVSNELKIPFITNLLIRTKYNVTQTIKNKNERQLDKEEIFEIQDFESYKGKHLLLIDDVITTGATLERCSLALNKIPNIKLSIVTIAYTQS